ncbi:MAG: hypothetical protein HY077_03755 [Elusimicrobia bacterium]|nr:hypothetical protein [Elusimicrobiota bacterium]
MKLDTAKKGFKAGVALAAVLVAAVSFYAYANVNHDADRKALLSIKDAYENALNGDDLGKLTPHLDADFSGVMATGAEIKSSKEWQAHWNQVKGLIGYGHGGKYHVTVHPTAGASMFVSDVAVSFGSTDESVTTAKDNKEYNFHSSWVAVSRNRGGTWKLASVHTSILNPENIFSKTQLEEVAKLVAELKKKNP